MASLRHFENRRAEAKRSINEATELGEQIAAQLK